MSGKALVRPCGWSAVVGEAFLKALAGGEDAALDGAEGKVHFLGDILVLVAGHVHREGDAVFVGEGVDGRGDFVGGKGAVGGLAGGLCGEVDEGLVVGGVYYGGGTGHAAVVVDEDIPHDGEYPSLEVGTFCVFVFIVQGLEGRVLKEVVGIVAVGGQHICEVEHVGLKAHEAGLKFCACHNE